MRCLSSGRPGFLCTGHALRKFFHRCGLSSLAVAGTGHWRDQQQIQFDELVCYTARAQLWSPPPENSKMVSRLLIRSSTDVSRRLAAGSLCFDCRAWLPAFATTRRSRCLGHACKIVESVGAWGGIKGLRPLASLASLAPLDPLDPLDPLAPLASLARLNPLATLAPLLPS